MLNRIIIVLSLLLAPTVPAGAAYALIAHTGIGGASPLTSSAINTTGANLLIVTINNFSGDPAAATVADPPFSNTWHPLVSQTTAGGESNTVIFYAWNATVGASHTVTVTVTSFPAITFSAWSGSRTSSDPLQVPQNGTASVTGVSTIQPGSITPPSNNSLVITSVGSGGSVSSGFSINSGFTILDQIPYAGGSNEANASAYLIQGTAAAVNPTWTWTAGNSAAVSIASFAAAAGGGGNMTLLGVGPEEK